MPQEFELNLRDYWNILRRRRLVAISLFVLVFISTIIYTNLLPSLYKAVSVIKIEPSVGLSQIFPDKRYRFNRSELIDYEKQVVSLPILQKAVKESGLMRKNAPQAELDNLVSTVAGNISAWAIEKSNMIRIEMVSEDPREAAIIVNKVVEVFKLENVRQKNAQVQNVREFIEKQLQRVSAELEESENGLKELILKGIGGMAIALTSKIAELQLAHVDLLKEFTEMHPEIMRIEEQISFLKEQLKNLPREEFEFNILKRNVLLNEKLYILLRERLQEVQIKESEKIDNVIIISPAVVPRFPFSPHRAVNYMMGAIFGIVLSVFVGFLIEHLDTSIGKIEDLENITKINVVGVIPFFSGKNRDTKKRWFREKKHIFIRSKKGSRVEKLQTQLIATHNEGSVFLEAFRTFGTNVQAIFGQEGRIKGKIILITSSNSLEGKSIVASNLSIIMAQMGYKTLLIDIDLRRSMIHSIFGIQRKDKGFTEILAGDIPLESGVRKVGDLLLGNMSQDDILRNPWIDNLHLITAGKTPPNTLYLLSTQRLDDCLKSLRQIYDVVVIDSSPVLPVSDTAMLVPKIDGVVLVYRTGTTSRMALHRAQTQIESAKSKGIIKGIVLNNVTPEASIDTDYYYHQRGYYNK